MFHTALPIAPGTHYTPVRPESQNAELVHAVAELEDTGLEDLAWLLDGNVGEIPPEFLRRLNAVIG